MKTIAHPAVANAPLLGGSVIQEQIDLEVRAVTDGIKRYADNVRKTVARGDGASLKPAERLLTHWFEVYAAAIDDERRACRAGEAGQCRSIIGPVLELLDPSQMAVIAMHEAVSLCMARPSGDKTAHLAYAIGRAVMGEINLGVIASTDRDLLRQLDMKYKRRTPGRLNWWAHKNLDNAIHVRKGATHIGAYLLDTLIDCATCGDWMDDRFIPAFQRELRREGRGTNSKTVGYTFLTEEAWAIIDSGHRVRQLMRPRYLPMIVPPFKWFTQAADGHNTQGGYAKIRTPYTAKPTPTQKKALAAADLSTMNDCLDAVGGQSWRINRRLYAVQRAIWESGGNDLGIPRRDSYPAPAKPHGYDPTAPEKSRWLTVDPEVKKAYKREAARVHDLNTPLRSARKEWLQKMEVADLMKGRPAFWYPHQLDFRGRAYPIPPHLNHQNDDVARGLLEFADGRAVDDEARDELLIEAANCYGYDKIPFRDRIQWARDNMRHIEQTASDPVDQAWWRKADKPWQFLAACYALTDPECAAHAPVRRDGTCNGLQHYAALGRDSIGARAVNLIPSDSPNDVYADVAGSTRSVIERDAREATRIVQYKVWHKDGPPEVREISMARIAEMIAPHMNRKTAKPSTMTTVYGVTLSGATDQVVEKLKEAGLEDKALYAASQYVARQIMAGVGEVCPAARALMDWLKTCAREISGGGNPVQWTTPLGLPVVQPYHLLRNYEVKSSLGKLLVQMPDERMPIDIRDQCAGFAPNFIHSIDSTHMFMCARECRDEGIAFAATHDCYWTHAADCQRLNRITREQFLSLHERPILHDLLSELRRRNPDAELPEPPEPGDLDLSVVLDSPYFFG